MRRRKKKRIMIGEKIIGIGFFLITFMGSALDGPEWKIPLVGVIVGIATMEIGVVIARMEGSEYV